jgi:hypothetical protein
MRLARQSFRKSHSNCICALKAPLDVQQSTMLPLKFFAAGIATLIFAEVALAEGGPSLAQIHAYEGARRPLAQIATVYGVRRFNPLGRSATCEVDGKSVRGFVGCRSIVYLLPGSHRLQTFYSSTAVQTAYGTITASFAAGRVYQIESERAGDRVSFRLREKPPGFVLTYKDVLPDNPMLSTAVGNMRIDPAQ